VSERIFKISQYLVRLWVSKLFASSTMCAGRCPAERWENLLEI